MATTPARNATRNVLRAPVSSWENTSCWTWVVPSQCAADGGCGTPLVVDRLADGLYGATHGPTTASTKNAASRASPVMILGERGSWTLRVFRRGGQHRQRAVRAGPAGPVPLTPSPSTLPPRSVPIDMAQASWRVRGSRNT